jgi:sortase A
MTRTLHPRTLSRVMAVVEGVLAAVALTAFVWVGYDRYMEARDQALWAQQLEMQAEAVAQPQQPPGPKAARPLPVPGAVIGRLELPRLGVSAIAREGADAKILKRAVGHVPRTALPGEDGNAAFAGHRDTFFRGLRNVRIGDQIVITTAAGRHEYLVRDTRIVKPTDVSVLKPTTAPSVTLVTCYPFNYIGSAPQRFIVRAELSRPSAVASLH